MNEVKDPKPGDPEATPRHETGDLRIRGIVLFGLGFILVMALIHVGIRGVFAFLDRAAVRHDSSASPLAESRSLPSVPRLEVHPGRDLEAVRKTEDATLATYGWIDRSNHVLRMPIERALELLAQRGLPTRKEPVRDSHER